jgi:hypothetical protein
MKNFIISEEERVKILEMHKKATSNQYLKEQEDTQSTTASSGAKIFIKAGLPVSKEANLELSKHEFLTLGSFGSMLKSYYNDPGYGAGIVGKPLFYLNNTNINPTQQSGTNNLSGEHAGVDNTNLRKTPIVQSIYIGQGLSGKYFCYVFTSKQAIFAKTKLIDLSKNDGTGNTNIPIKHPGTNFEVYPYNEKNFPTTGGGDTTYFGKNGGRDIDKLRVVGYDYYIDLSGTDLLSIYDSKQQKIGFIPKVAINLTNNTNGVMFGVDIR